MLCARGRRPRILLFGNTGQLGWELRRSVASMGEVIIACDRAPPPERMQDQVGASAERRIDLTDSDAIRRVVQQTVPDVILNAAAFTAVDLAEDEPHLANAVNATAPRIMAEEAERLGAWMVHYSTDYVFAGEKATGYTEDDIPRPGNHYGVSKLAGEEAVRASGCRHLVLRTSWLYSARGHNFLLTILRLLDEERSLQVVNDQFGAPTSARNVADVTAQLLAQASAADDAWLCERSGTYHLTSSGRCSWYEFAQWIIKGCYVGTYEPGLSPVTSADYPVKARRPTYSLLDCSRFTDAFNLSLPDWRESFDRVIEELTCPSVHYPWFHSEGRT